MYGADGGSPAEVALELAATALVDGTGTHHGGTVVLDASSQWWRPVRIEVNCEVRKSGNESAAIGTLRSVSNSSWQSQLEIIKRASSTAGNGTTGTWDTEILPMDLSMVTIPGADVDLMLEVNGDVVEIRFSTNPLHRPDVGSVGSPLYKSWVDGSSDPVTVTGVRDPMTDDWSVNLSTATELHRAVTRVGDVVSRVLMRCSHSDGTADPINVRVEFLDGTVLTGEGEVELVRWTVGNPQFPARATVIIQVDSPSQGPVTVQRSDVRLDGSLDISDLLGGGDNTTNPNGSVNSDANGSDGGFIPGFGALATVATITAGAFAGLAVVARRRDD